MANRQSLTPQQTVDLQAQIAADPRVRAIMADPRFSTPMLRDAAVNDYLTNSPTSPLKGVASFGSPYTTEARGTTGGFHYDLPSGKLNFEDLDPHPNAVRNIGLAAVTAATLGAASPAVTGAGWFGMGGAGAQTAAGVQGVQDAIYGGYGGAAGGTGAAAGVSGVEDAIYGTGSTATGVGSGASAAGASAKNAAGGGFGWWDAIKTGAGALGSVLANKRANASQDETRREFDVTSGQNQQALDIRQSQLSPYRAANAQANSLTNMDRAMNTTQPSVDRSGRYARYQPGGYTMSPELIKWLAELQRRVASGEAQNPNIGPTPLPAPRAL